ncbi:MAG: phosphoenolpyruvate carboxykinase (GTP), partial [Chloroflexi bacterium]|nr:phosphoenolpyruvate carboxykinase (GTP) [Chloroflexota bacterium]
VGVLRHDPMAMLPFCGYDMGDYWNHWLEMGKKASQAPAVFHVNWFRRDADGRFIWPGFGQNMRVLQWIYGRVKGRAEDGSVDTPIGTVPTAAALGTSDLGLTAEQAKVLLDVDRSEWQREAAEYAQFLSQYDESLPAEIRNQQGALERRLAG